MRKGILLAGLALAIAACSQSSQNNLDAQAVSIGAFRATSFGPNYHVFAFRFADVGWPDPQNLAAISPFTCEIDFTNNGSIDGTLNPCEPWQQFSTTATDSVANQAYTEPGTYTARLVVTNTLTQQSQTRTTQVVVRNVAPYINIFEVTDPSTTSAPYNVNFQFMVGDPNPQDFAFTNTLTCRLDVDGNGTWDYIYNPCVPGTLIDQAHTYPRTLNASARLQVVDRWGATATAQVRISTTVPNQNDIPNIPLTDGGFPNFRKTTPGMTQDTGPWSVTFRWLFTDANFTTLTCQLDPEGDGLYNYTISPCAAGVEVQQAHTYTKRGQYYPRLRINDGRGGVAEMVYQGQEAGDNRFLVLRNMAPVISNYSATPLTGLAPLRVAFRFTASDPDGDPLVCSLDANNNVDVGYEGYLPSCTYNAPVGVSFSFTYPDNSGSPYSSIVQVQDSMLEPAIAITFSDTDSETSSITVTP